MARKITFEVAPDEPATKMGSKQAPALTGMARSLQAAAAAGVRDIDVSLIDDSPHQDRLSVDQAEIEELAHSIAQNGQLVPILVSPLPAGRFRIVYGRRRLLALRHLGLAAKALVRDLTDDQAIIAQGQENTSRKDLSWIEKAAFAAQLLADGKPDALIADALNIDQKARVSGGKLTNVSRLRQVLNKIDLDLIRAIGAAPGYGRDRWYNLAQEVERAGFPAGNQQILIQAANAATGGSDARFAAVAAVLTQTKSLPAAEPTPDAAGPGQVRSTNKQVTITVTAAASKDLHAWIRSNPQHALNALVEAHTKSKQQK